MSDRKEESPKDAHHETPHKLQNELLASQDSRDMLNDLEQGDCQAYHYIPVFRSPTNISCFLFFSLAFFFLRFSSFRRLSSSSNSLTFSPK